MPLQSIFDTKLQQFSVQFACRTSTRKDLTASEKDALKTELETSDPEFFQRFQDAPANFFQMLREYPIGAMTVTAPSFVMNNNSVTLLKPIKLADKKFFDSIDTLFSSYMPSLNNEMSSTLLKVQNIIRGIQYQRAGKIYEFVLAPYQSDEKKSLLEKVLQYPLDDVGEINVSLTRHVTESGQTYNILTNLLLRQMKLQDPFQLNVRIDINNRDLKESLEPGQIRQIWTKADVLLEPHLETLFDL